MSAEASSATRTSGPRCARMAIASTPIASAIHGRGEHALLASMITAASSARDSAYGVNSKPQGFDCMNGCRR